jgi:hypothetical protein
MKETTNNRNYTLAKRIKWKNMNILLSRKFIIFILVLRDCSFLKNLIAADQINFAKNKENM